MPGFRIANIPCKKGQYKYRYSDTVENQLIYNEWNVSRSTLNKFLNDKIWFEDDELIIILEGTTLNSRSLIDKYHEADWISTIRDMVSLSTEWFSELEGPVSGAVYYKRDKKWIVFTSKLGEKAVFFYNDGAFTIIGSQIKDVVDILHDNDIKTHPNVDALQHFMAYQSYIGTETCILDIQRLYPGSYIEISAGKVNITEYCKFDIRQDEVKKTEKEYIQLLDGAFRNAMQLILDKNKEYGYTTVADISGGYDSRLNCYVIHSLNASDVIMDCYAQSDSHDFRVSNAIANELGYDYVFRSLDNASCMMNIDDNVIMLNGASVYSGITGGRDMLHMLSGLDIGMEVTGLLGDVHDGSMVTNRCDGEIDIDLYRDSTTLEQKCDFLFPNTEEKRFKYHENEHFWFYNRGMICGMSSFFIRQFFTEPATAFGNSEFLKVYLSIPWDMRVNGKLLRKWMAWTYPGSGKYTNYRNGLSLSADIKDKYNVWTKIYKNIKKYENKFYKNKKPIGMNDVTYWYKNNQRFQNYIDEYIQKNMYTIIGQEDIEASVKKLLASNLVGDKMIVVTVMSLFKNIVLDGDRANA